MSLVASVRTILTAQLSSLFKSSSINLLGKEGGPYDDRL